MRKQRSDSVGGGGGLGWGESEEEEEEGRFLFYLFVFIVFFIGAYQQLCGKISRFKETEQCDTDLSV